MTNREPLTQAQKEAIYQGKLKGQTLETLAKAGNCKPITARKWWRVGRAKGLEGLKAVRRGRGKTGYLSQFPRPLVEQALAEKRLHPGWGAKRVLVELRRQPEFQGMRLPSPSRLAEFFQAICPECVAPRKPRPTPIPAPPTGHFAHEVWLMDSQEGILLVDGEIATVCNIRDPFGAAMIASQAFAVRTPRHWRKLTWEENRQVLRGSFSEWGTLPEIVLTDNELGLAGTANDPFPGWLTLWLVGLGIQHRFIRPGRPTDQSQVERNHRTLDNWVLNPTARTDLVHLQAALDEERITYNTLFPTQASDCAGRPPLTAHPELLRPRRPYQVEHELALFDLQRVFDYLATFTFVRKINASAQVSLGRIFYSLGKPLVREKQLDRMWVRMDPSSREWVFQTEQGVELIRRPAKGYDLSSLTGLEPTPAAQPIQLSFPLMVA